MRSSIPWLAPNGTATFLIGTSRAGVVVTAVVVGAKVDCLAAERAAPVDERLMLLDGHSGRIGSRRGLRQLILRRCIFCLVLSFLVLSVLHVVS
ncbi:hypothetical protein F4821DRAFT_229737 [Hypoxylon rubiginosum]|uniref:Uncharacterized protein n=1 Tax=Hypoxylon rubiginosum TaxID=110542 RepID=A0ACC0DBM1_9PEZI|nr:hypothetical protein F4821DRAFT_229737 [Hypoxylon rubiginosum]